MSHSKQIYSNYVPMGQGRRGEKRCACSVQCTKHSHQTSQIMILITNINESNLQIQEPTSQLLGRICSAAAAAEQSERDMHRTYTEGKVFYFCCFSAEISNGKFLIQTKRSRSNPINLKGTKPTAFTSQYQVGKHKNLCFRNRMWINSHQVSPLQNLKKKKMSDYQSTVSASKTHH